MAKDKEEQALEKTRDLGTVKKRLSSGMYETSKGERIPPFPGVNIGDKVKLEKGRFMLDRKQTEGHSVFEDPRDKKIAELSAKNAALEKKVGTLGSKVGGVERAVQGMISTDTVSRAPSEAPVEPPKAGGGDNA